MKIIDKYGREQTQSRLLPDGDLENLALSFTNEPHQGVYRPASGAIALVSDVQVCASLLADYLTLHTGVGLTFSPDDTRPGDLFLLRSGAGSLQLGRNLSSPVAQTLKVGDASGTNVAGADLSVAAGKGTGNANGGSLLFKTAPAGAGSGTTAGTLATRLQIAADGSSTFNGELKFSGTDHPGLRLNGLTETQRDALTAAAGMLLWNSTKSLLNIYDGSSWQGVPQHPVEDQGRVFLSRLPNVATTITLIGTTAYFVYLGRVVSPITVNYIEFFVNTAVGSGLSCEGGLFSTPLPPNKSGQTLTKLTSTANMPNLMSTGVVRNTSALGYTVPAGTCLWAGIRTASGTQPALAGLCMDYGQGLVLNTSSAGSFGSGSSWSGGLVSVPGAGYLGSAVAPDLRITLD